YNGNNTNGQIMPVIPNWWRTSGMSMDETGNLWIGVSDVTRYLSVKKTDGNFQNFLFDGIARFVRKVYCDKNNQVWILHERDQGLTVAKFTPSGSNLTLSTYKVLNKNVGSGNLGSNSVYAFCEDLDGKIWIGTANGIRVFNNPDNVLSGGSVDGEPIKIVQDGNVELLLDAEVVTSIEVDAANNKWVGTQAGGIYCFSPDGQKQIYHFTADNSNLYSDEIVDIKYNGKTGDVFIGSSLGIQSYKNLIIDGSENYSEVKAYPNPVKPNYTGNVFISGLIDNSIVKIVDESGNFVWEVKSEGGRVVWPLKNFSNTRVPSGVYLIYAAVPTGEFKAVSKILVIN
ncbi:MAG: two-component regulator propeller domain-containing protein, partial [Bacteroidia bacterium]